MCIAPVVNHVLVSDCDSKDTNRDQMFDACKSNLGHF
jgi:hypothetical protein